MVECRPPPPTHSARWRRALLIVVGCLSMALGVIGIVLPLLPTTPFVLLAALCFAGAWPSMHERLARTRIFGPMIRSDGGRRSIPRRTKVFAIAFTLLSIGTTIHFVVEALWLRIGLAMIAAGVTTFLLWMPSTPGTGGQAVGVRDPSSGS